MRNMLKLIVIAVAIATVLATTQDEEDAFNEFMSTHNKVYESRQLPYRKWVFLNNLNLINKHNEMATNNSFTYTLAVNEFADMESEEFVSVMNGYRMTKTTENLLFEPDRRVTADLPATVDWRTKGYVSGVKNQGQCGSCWAFSATGSLEGQHFKATGKMVSLSEQNLMDCVKESHSCQGGLMDYAFQYVINNKGIDTEASYPYEAKDDTCRYNAKYRGATCEKYRDIQAGSESALQEATATIGPISVAIDASHFSFQFYHSGVYTESQCSSTKLDHGVLVVGYGTYIGQEYWLVKNSWGESWGLKGYIRMSRNKNNQCGIATKASYPIVNAN